MKKLFLSLALVATALMSVNAQTIYPKKCITVTSPVAKMRQLDNKGAKAFGAPNFHIVTSKASVSQVVLPIGLTEATISNGSIFTGNTLSVGAGYVFGAANATVYEDSTVLITGLTYYGITALYGVTSLSSSQQSSFIVGGLVGYSIFAGGAGIDLLAKENMFRIYMTANLSGLLPSSWTNIKL